APLVCALGGTQVRSNEGRVPIFEPTTIVDPGHYVVTRDFVAPGTAITIAANDVTLDLNGYTLTGPVSCAGDPHVIVVDTATATRGIVIRNGRLINGCAGIFGTNHAAPRE